MKSKRLICVLAAMSVILFGCSVFDTSIQTANISGTLNRVISRMDDYVQGDDTLSTATKTADQVQAANVLTQVQGSSSLPASAVSTQLKTILAIHDSYVTADTTLNDLNRREDLRESSLLRTLLGLTPAPTTAR